MLYCGIGIDVNKDEAIQFIKKGADNGNPDSSYLYAELLYNGIEMDKNKELASHYFKISADHGNIQAMLNYATMKWIGNDVEINKKEAITYYKLVYNNGDEESLEKFTVEHHRKMIEESTRIMSIFNSYRNRKGKFLECIKEIFIFIKNKITFSHTYIAI